MATTNKKIKQTIILLAQGINWKTCEFVGINCNIFRKYHSLRKKFNIYRRY